MGAQQARLQPDRLPEQADAFRKSFLLKTDRTQDRVGYSASSWVGKGKLRLLICLLEPPLLDQCDRFLKSLTRIGSQISHCTQE